MWGLPASFGIDLHIGGSTSYVNSVQQVAITIGSGTTSASATINAVGSGAFIVWQGWTTNQTTSNGSVEDTRIELTNSTTVTAYRNTSSTNTVTVNAVIIDGNTINLVKSVQNGTVTIASGSSGTVSISAVTNANTAIFHLGSTSNETTGNELGNNQTVLSLSGTTLTSTRGGSGAPNTVTTGFCVVEFYGSALNSSIQNFAYNATINATSDTKSITSVNVNNTILAWGGMATPSGGTTTSRLIAQLTNSTTITLAWNTSGSYQRLCNLCVIEFAAGVLKSSIKRGTISLSNATSNTATISAVNPSYSFANWLNNTGSASGTQDIIYYRQTLTNGTTITDTVNTASTGMGSYEVAEFN